MCRLRTSRSTTSSSTKRCVSRATVNEALHEYIQRRRQTKLVELFGTIEWEPDFDYKKQRRRL
jgi:hypothetical protein